MGLHLILYSLLELRCNYFTGSVRASVGSLWTWGRTVLDEARHRRLIIVLQTVCLLWL